MDPETASNYRRFIEGLSPQTISRLDDLAAPNIHLRDPFNDAHGLDNVKKVLHWHFRDVDDPRFVVTHTAPDGETCFYRWKFTCRPRMMRRGHPWIVDGVTEVRFDSRGKAIEHTDYWDSGYYVYERIPLFGYVIRWLRKHLGTVLR